MAEKTKIYMFIVARTKGGKKGKTGGVWKRELYTGICDNCEKTFDLNYLELEHKIPISVGGSLINKENLRLFCKECHKIKTRKDNIVMNFLKKIKLFNEVFIFITPEKLHEIYIYLYNLLEEGEANFKKWSHGSTGIDYEQKLYKENWEGKE